MRSEVSVARWTAGEVARRIGADVVGAPDAAFDAVTTDSRGARPGSAFFALDGSRVRGVQFVPEAFGSGCSVVVVPRDWTGDPPAGRAALRHDDPLVALADLAAASRAEWSCPVLAVTGSVGKTTVKEMTGCVLEARGPVLRSPGNLNTVVGLATTLLGWEEEPRIAILEVGASLPGEVARLARIVRPTAAAVTNAGAAHLEGFGSVDAVAQEKADLLRAVPADGLCLVDGDDPRLVEIAASLPGPVTRVGLGSGNDLLARDLEPLTGGGTRFRVAGAVGDHGRALPAELSVPGEHQVRNALFALAFGAAHEVPVEEGLERLRGFRGVAGRLVVKELAGVTVVDDTYNSNPASARAALDWFVGVEAKGRKAVVLGDMLELGNDSERYHGEIGRRVADLAIDLAVFVGAESRAAFEEGRGRIGDPKKFRHVPDSEEAARVLARWARPGDAVLVKGSRGMNMERVVQALAQRRSADAV